MSTKLSDINKNFSDWYQDVIDEAQLAEHGPVRGSMVIRPYGYALWELIQQALDKKIKQSGTENAYFPLFIPESFLKKEAKHVEGFSPELAVVTHAGGRKLDEPLIVRPTSETMMYYMFSKWISSWRDLPLRINQWANIVRWEMRPRLFLRTTEILWQEGHTAYATEQEAKKDALDMQQLYKMFIEGYLAIPVLAGEKPESERFAGADHTFTMESMMQDGRALQMGTTHVLSKSFSDAFGIEYQDKDGSVKSPYCTSWGVTTRLIGALIMVHGDQNGLVIPPKVAPIQVIIIPIFRTEKEKTAILEKVKEIEKELIESGIRVKIDIDEQKTPGAKFFHWEVRGVPIRIEIGPKDLTDGSVICVNRAENDKNKKKTAVKYSDLASQIPLMLTAIHKQLFDRAMKFRQDNWFQVDNIDDFGDALEKEGGFYQAGWCGDISCEERFKKHKATVRCILEDADHAHCCVCKKESSNDIVIAKAY